MTRSLPSWRWRRESMPSRASIWLLGSIPGKDSCFGAGILLTKFTKFIKFQQGVLFSAAQRSFLNLIFTRRHRERRAIRGPLQQLGKFVFFILMYKQVGTDIFCGPRSVL